MNRQDLVHQKAQIMIDAFNATNRQDALDLIHKADKIQQAINVIDNPDRWCGGPGGFDDYTERMH